MPTTRSALMNDAKYIGLDVHQATISVAVLDSAGKLVMEAIVETKAETILQCMHGLRGCTICSSRMSRVCWSRIRVRTIWEEMETGMIAATPASWPSCCIGTR